MYLNVYWGTFAVVDGKPTGLAFPFAGKDISQWKVGVDCVKCIRNSNKNVTRHPEIPSLLHSLFIARA
jgi:hypothetical protein